jgi:hypothetical protein
MVACDIGDIDSVSLQVHMGGAVWLTVPSLQIEANYTTESTNVQGGGHLPMTFADVDGVKTCDVAPGTYRLLVAGADTDPAAHVVITRIQ